MCKMKMGNRVFRTRLAQKTGAASEAEDVEAGTSTPGFDFNIGVWLVNASIGDSGPERAGLNEDPAFVFHRDRELLCPTH